jgi:adsorption protein B
METLYHIFVVLAYVAGIGFLLSGLDDMIFDTQFLLFLWRQRKKPPVTMQQLRLAQEQWIALLVPAWQEGGVVNKMTEYAAKVIIYEKYDIFIGVYPNDPETNHCVDEACANNPRLHKIVVPHPGPTSKADCLNWIYRAVRLNEIPGVREYAVIALHDSEDILHPLTLKVYNYFVPTKYDMGQLPVFALELPVWKYWVGNIYVDDFAELHTKDMFVRESIGGIVPSAGVGTAFSRQLMEALGAENGGDPFRIGNLTEDYEIGIRAKRAGYRVGVVSYPVERLVRRARKDGSLGAPETVTEIVAVREPFPTNFAVCVRQRSRWILGISFQTWEQTGWAGSWAVRYTLLRDRRAPLTHLINMIGYIVLLFALFQIGFKYTPWAASVYLPPLFTADSLLWKIAILCTCLLGYRIIQKMISVYSIYNLKQAIFSIPRMIISNLVNFLATWRATRMYAANKLFGTPLVWLKTAHFFPDEADLSEYKRTIEDLLVAEGLVTREQIVAALEVEKSVSVPLALLRLGLLDEEQFTDIWSKYSKLPVQTVNPSDVAGTLLGEFAEQRSVACDAIPLKEENGRVVIAFREPPADGQMLKMRSFFGGKTVTPVLCRPSNIDYARARIYPRVVLPPSRTQQLLDRFQQASGAEPRVFLEALINTHSSRRALPDVLTDRGMLDEGVARKLWAEVVGVPLWETKLFTLDPECYTRGGAGFWWLHRMLPATGGRILTAFTPHPEVVALLGSKLSVPPNLRAELPGKFELITRAAGISFDTDQALVDRLVIDGTLKKQDVPDVKELRTLIADPIPKWLLVQKLVSGEQLHRAFVAIAGLPDAGDWNTGEARRLAVILPPGFACEYRVYPLDEKQGAIRLGLAQMPSLETLHAIYDRLSGYSLCFQALSVADAARLHELNQPR